MSDLGKLSLAGAMVMALGAAATPKGLAGVSAGLWEVRGMPGAERPVRRCIAQPAALAQFEHQGQTCTRVVISSAGTETEIHYTCAKGGFGRSKLTALTPRSLRIETQGISRNLPFNYVLQAHRIGNCAAH